MINTKRLSALFETPDKRTEARKMGLTYQAIQNIINGSDPRISTIEAIAKYYNVPVGYFFDEAEADGRSAHEVEIANLKGQIKGLENALKLLGVKQKNAKNQ